jgi:Holliday junction resolvase RusA-like endonuclease
MNTLLAEPDLVITVHGVPGPQGSKTPTGNFRPTKNGGQAPILKESSAKVKPWRQDVKAAALAVTDNGRLAPLDGPLLASMVFTVREQPTSKPTWWPSGLRWSKTLQWRPASTPDLSKLLRATEDALTGVAWKDDARVVEYVRLAKFYAGHPAEDVLPHGSGAVIRIWRLT